jgi:hypothetical protein
MFHEFEKIRRKDRNQESKRRQGYVKLSRQRMAKEKYKAESLYANNPAKGCYVGDIYFETTSEASAYSRLCRAYDFVATQSNIQLNEGFMTIDFMCGRKQPDGSIVITAIDCKPDLKGVALVTPKCRDKAARLLAKCGLKLHYCDHRGEIIE